MGKIFSDWKISASLTVVFEFNDKTAYVITAYPSSETQIKFYKKKKN